MNHKKINISLQIIVILISSFYIYNEINTSNHSHFLNFFTHVKSNFSKNLSIILIVFILTFINWLLEALKWETLIKKIEKISLSNSYKSILIGLSFGLTSPNRIGEIAGRALCLKKASRGQAIVISSIGSFSQFLSCFFFGTIAFTIFTNSYLSNPITKIIEILIYIANILLFYFYYNPSLILKVLTKIKANKLISYCQVTKEFNKKELSKVLIYSFLRYIIFTIQFYIITIFVEEKLPFFETIMMISLVYFVFSIIPTFIITELGVKGSAAIFFFNYITSNTPAILSSIFLLWFLNIIIPAIIGILFIKNVKLIRNEPHR